MSKRASALFGIVGLLVAFISIGISIAFSPWFSWQVNALSDLGHAIKSEVAPIFNFGLLVAGLLLIIYVAMVLREHAKYTSIFLAISFLSLQLIAVFDEVYGSLHFVVSVLFFAFLHLTLVIYAFERKSKLAVVAFIVGLTSWLVYWAQIFTIGLAVPELVSSVAAAVLIVHFAVDLYFSK